MIRLQKRRSSTSGPAAGPSTSCWMSPMGGGSVGWCGDGVSQHFAPSPPASTSYWHVAIGGRLWICRTFLSVSRWVFSYSFCACFCVLFQMLSSIALPCSIYSHSGQLFLCYLDESMWLKNIDRLTDCWLKCTNSTLISFWTSKET